MTGRPLTWLPGDGSLPHEEHQRVIGRTTVELVGHAPPARHSFCHIRDTQGGGGCGHVALIPFTPTLSREGRGGREVSADCFFTLKHLLSSSSPPTAPSA